MASRFNLIGAVEFVVFSGKLHEITLLQGDQMGDLHALVPGVALPNLISVVVEANDGSSREPGDGASRATNTTAKIENLTNWTK